MLVSKNAIPSKLLKILLCVYQSLDIISKLDLKTTENILLLFQHGMNDAVTKLAIVSELEIQHLLQPEIIKCERTCLILLSIINQFDLRSFETVELVKYAILPHLLVVEGFMEKQVFLLEFTKLQNSILKAMVEIARPVKKFVEEKVKTVANSFPNILNIIEREMINKNLQKFFPLLFNADSKSMYQNFVLHCYQCFLKTFNDTKAKENQSDSKSVLTIFKLQFKLVLLKSDAITSFDVLEQLFRENGYQRVMSHIEETKDLDFNQALNKSSLVFLNDQWSSFISKRMELQRLDFVENIRITASNSLVLNNFSISDGKIFSPGTDPIEISKIKDLKLIQKQFTFQNDEYSTIKRQSLYPALKIETTSSSLLIFKTLFIRDYFYDALVLLTKPHLTKRLNFSSTYYKEKSSFLTTLMLRQLQNIPDVSQLDSNLTVSDIPAPEDYNFCS